MSSSAIATPQFQAKIGSIQNQADTSAVYNAGVWSFKNSTALTSVTITDAGAVTLGSTVGSTTHLVRSGDNTVLRVLSGAYTGTQTSAISLGLATADRFWIGYEVAPNEFSIRYDTSSATLPATKYATCGPGGNWTFGQTSGTSEVEHLISGYRTGGSSAAMNFQNRSTSTACPAFNVIKGSADTTTGHRLVTFTVNGGSNGAGQINVNGANACAFGSYSDRRLKENIVPLSGELEKVLALNPVEFDYIEGGHQVGFVAQEIEDVYPDAVSILGETEEMKMVTGWDKTTARLVKAIQELSAKVDAQAAEIEALKAK